MKPDSFLLSLPQLVSLLTLLLAGLAVAAPVDLFVAPAGNDANSGAAGQPFATIGRAMQAVRALDLAQTNPGPVTVTLAGGRYELTEPLVFTPADSGTASSPVTWRSAAGGQAVLSGGRALTGQWRQEPGQPYWSLPVPRLAGEPWVFHTITINGQSRERARTPNYGEKVCRAEGRAPGEDPRQAFRFLPGDIDATWTNLTDADIVLLCSWTPTVHRIEEVDPDRRVVRFHSSHGRTVDFWEKNFRYYVANVFEALDAPGEWYLNRATETLYYYPQPGEDMANLEVIAPVLKGRLMTLAGDAAPGQTIEHLRFEGLAFQHVDGNLDRYNGVYRQGHMFLDAAIWAKGLRHSVFVECELAHLGEYAMELVDGCQDNRIERCHIWDIGAGALQLGLTDLNALLATRNRLRPDDLLVEAEAGEVTAPMVIESSQSASGGRYVMLPKGQTGGSCVVRVTAPAAGPYQLLMRVLAPDGESDSFTVQVNDGPLHTYDTGNSRNWFLSTVVSRELGGQAVIAELAAGENRITISGREAGAQLDQVILRPHRPDQPAADLTEGEVLRNVVDNNVIHRLGTLWHGCYGIVNRFASYSTITHNDIFDTHWDAIGLDARWTWNGIKYAQGNVVAYNRLHHLGLRYHTDAAGVYQFGPLDTHIHHNVVHDTFAYPYICGYAGIYLDEQSRGALVENNLVYNVEWYAYFQHKGANNLFRNNIGAFARDGFFLRGSLNETWRANHCEVIGNIYLTRDGVGIQRQWQPGEEPPVVRRNLYHRVGGGEVTFAGGSLAEWQAAGQDLESVIGDPGFRDPERGDFSFRPDALAPQAIGFVPFDQEIAKAGLYGDPAWVSLPSRCERRTPSAVWSRDDLLRFVSFDLDFEESADGDPPPVFRVVSEGEATFQVTSEAAASGTKSLKCVDRKGLSKPFYPYLMVSPRKLTGDIMVGFDFMLPAESPAPFYLELRGDGFTSEVGPSLRVDADGTLSANGRRILRAAPGQWVRVEARFQVGRGGPAEYSLLTRQGDDTLTTAVGFGHAGFDDVSWLGICTVDDVDGSFYLDNLVFQFEP